MCPQRDTLSMADEVEKQKEEVLEEERRGVKARVVNEHMQARLIARERVQRKASKERRLQKERDYSANGLR